MSSPACPFALTQREVDEHGEQDNQFLEHVQDTEEALLDFTEERQVRLEKNDIQVVQFGVLWVPVTPRI